MTAAAVLVLAAGVLTLVVGFLGCCCMMDCKKLFGKYFTCLLVITIGVLAFVYKSKIRDKLDTSITDALATDYTEARPDTFSESWDKIHQDYFCCGYNNYTDYKGNPNLEVLNWDFPKSCCVEADGKPTDEAQCKSMTDEFFYKDVVGILTLAECNAPRYESI
ncbi:PREDICTED: tetraspanin-3-like [Priapulus caudatus]|uniref:Tetraspanin-3-like n=1 Tax=Priapulus caudatus TaxID=37621 RepID=A0ABM1DZP5_PRICU|nr:PREDICTED: tetraspanin-3-like [Priapulus caudatus]